MKKPIAEIEPVPSKRIFYSIIADYNLNRAICELIDNAIDQWTKGGRKSRLTVNLRLDLSQQSIRITDDAGGVRKNELEILVGPGLTSNKPEDPTIGLFGVGTKRAVVALAEDVKIKTRFGKQPGYMIEFDDSWLRDDSWKLPVYTVDEIQPGSTVIDLSRLRFRIESDHFERLTEHLRATYAVFLTDGRIAIKINGQSLQPLSFENWAFPPKFGPRRFIGTLPINDTSVKVTVVAGLSKESSPAKGDYGVYWYCNDRLVGRALKSHHVGFIKGLAGMPHPKVSLVRVIVFLNGQAQQMPWNSSKSGLNYEHPVFLALREWLVQIVKEYAALSRGWMGSWPDKVFRFKSGSISNIEVKNFDATKTYLPRLPSFRPRYGDKVRARNEGLFAKKPWSRGLSEGIVAVDLILKARLEQRNRIALILLDSTFEIALKEYLVHESGQQYSDGRIIQLFRDRRQVHSEVRKFKKFSAILWKKIGYYYDLRCKLIHERATVPITDDQVQDYRSIVEKVLQSLFGIEFL